MSFMFLTLLSSLISSAEVKVDKSIDAFSVKAANGSMQSLAEYKGKVILVVNVASKCGFTPQYTELEAVYEQYKDKGLVILGFPCNQFGSQEPGNDQEIQTFCKVNYGVTFPVFAKVDVNGEGADPVYKWLKSSAPGIAGTEAIKWNFTKFLLNRKGQVINRYAPQTKPKSLAKDIEKALAETI